MYTAPAQLNAQVQINSSGQVIQDSKPEIVVNPVILLPQTDSTSWVSKLAMDIQADFAKSLKSSNKFGNIYTSAEKYTQKGYSIELELEDELSVKKYYYVFMYGKVQKYRLKGKVNIYKDASLIGSIPFDRVKEKETDSYWYIYFFPVSTNRVDDDTPPQGELLAEVFNIINLGLNQFDSHFSEATTVPKPLPIQEKLGLYQERRKNLTLKEKGLFRNHVEAGGLFIPATSENEGIAGSSYPMNLKYFGTGGSFAYNRAFLDPDKPVPTSFGSLNAEYTYRNIWLNIYRDYTWDDGTSSPIKIGEDQGGITQHDLSLSYRWILGFETFSFHFLFDGGVSVAMESEYHDVIYTEDNNEYFGGSSGDYLLQTAGGERKEVRVGPKFGFGAIYGPPLGSFSFIFGGNIFFVDEISEGPSPQIYGKFRFGL
jgi:hypothetical protein